ncbi:MAG: DNA primase [Candidatus Doudnabacteria bacterium]|nr:DNA primase [Candidatus Doudnabacteria bacterium]
MADSVVQDIKDRLDIVEVIGSYLPLKRAGVNWRANCPFHNEKSPSFNVNPARQIWHCFGCGEGGDLFTFVQKYEHLEFPEALQQLADKAGVQLPERRPEDAARKLRAERLYRINTYVAAFYHKYLLSASGAAALAYLEGRGLTRETMESWHIGLAPMRAGELLQRLQTNRVSEGDLVDSGVYARSARGLYERFWGRVTFPIWSFSGKIVGFSARIMPGEQKAEAAKYINSPESPIYTKGHVLFGLYQAKNAIRERDYAVIVEGQMDCIKVHQAGFINTVATSGTAVTEDQLRLILRLTKNIVLGFDGDAAGQKAARKTGELALRLGFTVKILRMGEVKDPDEVISKGSDEWRKVLQGSELFILHYIQQAERDFPARSQAQRKFLTNDVMPLVGLVLDPVEREFYVKEITERFGISAASLHSVASHRGGAPRSQTEPQPEAEEVVQGVVASSLEKTLVGAFLTYPAICTEWQQLGGRADDFVSVEAQEVVAKLLVQDPAATASLFAKEVAFVVESEKNSYDGTEAGYLLNLRKTLYTFHLTALKNRQQQLTANIRSAEAEKDPAVLLNLQRAFVVLTQERLATERKLQTF